MYQGAPTGFPDEFGRNAGVYDQAQTSHAALQARDQPSAGVPAQIHELNERLEGAHKLLSTLHGRLESVLRPLPPSATESAAKQAPGAPLAEVIRAHKLSAEELCYRLSALLDALDL